MEDNSAYFGRRAKEERVAALKAADPRARRAHLEMAGHYDELRAVDPPVNAPAT